MQRMESDPLRGTIRGAAIFVSELRLQARVGVNPGEQGAEQPIVVDIWVGIEDMELAARSERLRDTMDYVAVARTARKVVELRHYPLVETLATAIAQAVLSRPGATWVRVRLRKLDCLRYASAAGVEVELGLADADPRPRPIAIGEELGLEEVAVVGGGAAGLAAMLWCWRLGHPALLVDPGPELGGQLHLVHGLMSDLPALDPMDGRALGRRLLRQLVGHGGRWLCGALRRVESEAGGCRLWLEGEDAGTSWARQLRARTVILATGVRRRSLEVPGERELAGRGILATGAKATEALAGKQVVVVGGGDSACENALLIARVGARVSLLHRGPRLTARAQLTRELATDPAIGVRLETRVTRLLGAIGLEAVEVEQGGEIARLPAQAALVRVGWLPNSEGFPARWLKPDGFVHADPSSGLIEGEQSVLAAGDLLGPVSSSVASSFGTAASAARTAILALER
jgi:thioredoxin reductase (NADPH)